MERHFEIELEKVKKAIMQMAGIVEEHFGLAVDAMLHEDETLANKIIEDDKRINELELDIDNAIVDLLALQHPLGSDLRFLVAALKINNDLERIGDHAVNIAESVRTLKAIPGSEPLMEIPEMAQIARTMLQKALDAFLYLKSDLASEVLHSDDSIDELNKRITREMIALAKSDTRTIDGAMELIRISRNLERVADLSTNIAEDVIFITQARVVKHHAEDRDDDEK